MPKSTYSAESPSGASPSEPQGGTTSYPVSLSLVHARRSPPQAKRKPAPIALEQTLSRALDELASSYADYAATHGMPTSAISGRKYGDSSETSALQSALANRSRAATAAYGSPLFVVRSTSWDMLLGPRIHAFRASAASTSGKGSTGSPEQSASAWPTPTAALANKGVRSLHGAIQEAMRSRGADLAAVSSLTHWPTAKASDGQGGRTTSTPGGGNAHLDKAVRMTDWATPTANDATNSEYAYSHGNHEKIILKLPGEAQKASWATPSSRDWRDRRASPETMDRNARPLNEQATQFAGWPTPMAGSPATETNNEAGNTDSSHKTVALDQGDRTLWGPMRFTASGMLLTGCYAQMEGGGQLDKNHSRWLLGIPDEWASCAPTATVSRRKSRPASSPPACSLSVTSMETSELTAKPSPNYAEPAPMPEIASAPVRALPTARFPVLLIDAPWRFATRSDKGRGRCPDGPVSRARQRENNPERHYPTMSLDEIKALPVPDLAEKNAILLMWAVDPMLPEALEVARHWGFKYKTVGFYWAKLRRTGSKRDLLHDELDHKMFPMGTGYYTRANPEPCLLFSRGKGLKRIATDVRKLIIAPRREHSRKPDECYDRIERLFEGPYLELFGRQSRANWTVWGNQATKFDAAATAITPQTFSRPAPSDPEGPIVTDIEDLIAEQRPTPTERVKKQRSRHADFAR